MAVFILYFCALLVLISADSSEIQIKGHTVKKPNQNKLITGFDIP